MDRDGRLADDGKRCYSAGRCVERLLLGKKIWVGFGEGNIVAPSLAGGLAYVQNECFVEARGSFSRTYIFVFC